MINKIIAYILGMLLGVFLLENVEGFLSDIQNKSYSLTVLIIRVLGRVTGFGFIGYVTCLFFLNIDKFQIL